MLVIEDDAEMNRFLCGILGADYRVASAANAGEGLSKAVELRPNLILADYALPDLDGEELLHRMGLARELEKTRLIFLSAKGDQELRVRMLRLGAKDFIQKPFSVDELRARVAAHVAASLAEAELEVARALAQRASAEWEKTFNSVPDLIAVTDAEHRIVRINQAMADRLGMLREQCVGRPCHELMHGLDHSWGECPIGLTAADGKEHYAEVHVERLGGDFLVSTTPIKDGGGQVAGVIHVARDITERKRIAEELASRERNYRELFNATSDALFVHDEAGRIVDVNDRMCELFGVDRATALSLSVGDLSLNEPPYSQAEAEALVRRAVNEGAQVFEWRSRKRNGELFWSEVALRVCRIAGRQRVIAAVRNITDRKRVEQELAAVSGLRADLISLVNHEYANVLMTMRLALARLKVSAEASGREGELDAYQILERALERLRTYTSNFLSLHRIEAGKLELNLQPTVIRSVVLDALLALRPLADAKRQRVSVVTLLAEELPIAVRADRECLSLIVTNLLNNAVKYTPESGSITVSMSLEGAGADQTVLFAVEDTGIGMPAEELARVKEGFYRTREGRETAQGFGVGLKVVTELLSKHDSQLVIQSTPGKGSRFSFRLPVWR